jgi:hypothetical protein
LVLLNLNSIKIVFILIIFFMLLVFQEFVRVRRDNWASFIAESRRGSLRYDTWSISSLNMKNKLMIGFKRSFCLWIFLIWIFGFCESIVAWLWLFLRFFSFIWTWGKFIFGLDNTVIRVDIFFLVSKYVGFAFLFDHDGVVRYWRNFELIARLRWVNEDF